MSFDYDYPDEHEYTIVTDDDLTVSVSKVGGGTIGREYVGSWHYAIRSSAGDVVMTGSNLHTGSPTSHDEAAIMVADFYTSD